MHKTCNILEHQNKYHTGCINCQHDCIDENEELKHELEKLRLYITIQKEIVSNILDNIENKNKHRD